MICHTSIPKLVVVKCVTWSFQWSYVEYLNDVKSRLFIFQNKYSRKALKNIERYKIFHFLLKKKVHHDYINNYWI